VRIGHPQLTAGQGRPVCQPWFPGDKAAGRRPKAMISTGLILSTFPKYAKNRMSQNSSTKMAIT